MREGIDKLRELKKASMLGGGPDSTERLHRMGKLSARERISRLVDAGSFVELNILAGHANGAAGDGVVAGHGTVEGRAVCLYAQDPTVMGGSIGSLHGAKIYRTVEMALDMGVPFVGLNDSPGYRFYRLDEPKPALFANQKLGPAIFYPITRASGVVPQISAIMGSCAGIGVYAPALTDFIYMVDGTSHMFITGPRIIKSVMAEDITMEELGGARVHCQTSGVADFRVKSEDECLAGIRKLLSFLPSNSSERPPLVDMGDSPDRWDDGLADIVPEQPYRPYDMHQVIRRIVDAGDFLEVKAEFAPEIIVGFARLDCQSVGIVANQPMVRAGSLTVDSSDKQARFMRFCDAFNIPLIVLVDTPAYAPGSEQEHAGIIRHGAKVLHALCEATVPRVCVVLRKCYGGGVLGMGVVPGLGTDFVYAWPSAEGLAAMGSREMVELFYADEYRKAPDPEQAKEEMTRQFRERYGNPFDEASAGPYLDDIIEPGETRRCLAKALGLLRTKNVRSYPKRHGNIPL